MRVVRWWDQTGRSAERRWTLHGPDRDDPLEGSGKAFDAPPHNVRREMARLDGLA